MSTYASIQRILPMICVVGMGFLMTNASQAAVLTLTAKDDVMLLGTTGGNPDSNYGNHVSLWVQYTSQTALNTSLLRFDLSSLPAGAEVTSAVLSLYLTTTASSGTTYIGAFALDPANYGWVETVSTYNNMLSETPWPAGSNGAVTGPYGTSHPGLLATKGFNSSTTTQAYTSFNDLYDESVFSQWQAHGYAEILLETVTANALRVAFSSSEGSFAPKLEITYTVVPEPGTLGLGLLSALLGFFALRRRK